jgi:hypothetical protein
MVAIKLVPSRNEFSQAWEYELLEDIEIEFRGQHIVVPRHFSYDGASVPWVAWQAIYTPFDPIVMGPALAHDWLYANHQLDRELADKLLKVLLRENGVPEYKVAIIFRAVDLFGEAAWENSDYDLGYLRWLYRRLQDEGADVARYRFPPEVVEPDESPVGGN